VGEDSFRVERVSFRDGRCSVVNRSSSDFWGSALWIAIRALAPVSRMHSAVCEFAEKKKRANMFVTVSTPFMSIAANM
jgi:hypothetical protein